MELPFISKGDFVDIEFTGRIKDSIIFDSNKKDIADKEKFREIKPLIVCVGYSMVVSGFDKALEGKEIGRSYLIELSPQEAFGERQSSLMKTLPLRVFHQQKINPEPGMSFLMDNALVRINAVSGGRVIADFNNPLAGKIIVYEFTIKRKIDDAGGKIKALMNFFLHQELPFTLKGGTIVIELDPNKPQHTSLAPVIETMKDQWREMLKLDIEILLQKQESLAQENQEIGIQTDSSTHTAT